MDYIGAINKVRRIFIDSIKPRKSWPKFLCVLLCYNDGDILEDVINHMMENHHDIIVWDHGSDDDTAEILDNYGSVFVERKFMPRSFDFYQLYPEMSRNLIRNYVNRYDWISWPDDDEILEGPDRTRPYYEHLLRVYHSPYNYIRFNNFNYWFTEKDDINIKSPVGRIRHYSMRPDCGPRIRSWRASATNIRQFNLNALWGRQYPVYFNLKHYPMRSYDRMIRRLNKDRINLQRNGNNYHYDNMRLNFSKMVLSPDQLHYDDGSELNHDVKFDWRALYERTG